MGKRGPKRTPTAILQFRGSRRAADRAGEPQAATGRPAKPKWLGVEAAKVWKQVVAHMETMDTLAKSDGAAIGRYCELLVRWISAAAFLRKYGETYPLKDEKGQVKCFAQFPQVGIVNRLSILLLRLEQEFGLTPASRAGLCVPTRQAPPVPARARTVGLIPGAR